MLQLVLLNLFQHCSSNYVFMRLSRLLSTQRSTHIRICSIRIVLNFHAFSRVLDRKLIIKMRIHLLQKNLSLSLLIKSMRKLTQKVILMLSLKALWILVYYFLRSNLLFIRLSSFSIVLSPHFIESYLFT